MLPGAGGQAVIAGQAVRQHAHVGGALHVVVAAEDVGAAAGNADIAERELQHAVGAGVAVAVGVLGAAHAPDEGAGPVLVQHLGDALELRAGHAGDLLGLFRRPLHDLLLDLVEAPDALLDVFLVDPAVLEDVVEDAPHQRDVGAGTEAHELVGMRRGAGEARIADDQLRLVQFLGTQDVLHGDRMRLGRIRAEQDHRLRIVHVVEGIGHGAVAPRVRDARDRGGVADARLVVAVVGAPEARRTCGTGRTARC